MIIQSIPLCSRCTMHEISSWLNEKSPEMEEDVLKEIFLELRAIKLKDGKCLVCGNNGIAGSSFENILKIMEKNNINSRIRNEFMRLFGICA